MLGLLLKSMKDIYGIFKNYCVNRPKGICMLIFDNFKNARSFKTLPILDFNRKRIKNITG